MSKRNQNSKTNNKNKKPKPLKNKLSSLAKGSLKFIISAVISAVITLGITFGVTDYCEKRHIAENEKAISATKDKLNNLIVNLDYASATGKLENIKNKDGYNDIYFYFQGLLSTYSNIHLIKTYLTHIFTTNKSHLKAFILLQH